MSQEDILQILNPNNELLRKKCLKQIEDTIWISKYDEEMAKNIVNTLFNSIATSFIKEFDTKEIAEKLNINSKTAFKNLFRLFESGDIKQRKVREGKVKKFKWSM